MHFLILILHTSLHHFSTTCMLIGIPILYSLHSITTYSLIHSLTPLSLSLCSITSYPFIGTSICIPTTHKCMCTSLGPVSSPIYPITTFSTNYLVSYSLSSHLIIPYVLPCDPLLLPMAIPKEYHT